MKILVTIIVLALAAACFGTAFLVSVPIPY
jgi:hypothetical protein